MIRDSRGGALAVTVLSGVLLAGCSSSTTLAQARLQATGDRKAAPNFELKDADGVAVRLSDYKGKVVLLNFWATWCGPCKVEIPWFTEFERRYKDRGFAVLGISMDDDGWPAVKPYLEAHNMNYRVVIGDDRVASLFGGIEALPTTMMIDREGRIASVHLGLVAKANTQQRSNISLRAMKDGRRRDAAALNQESAPVPLAKYRGWPGRPL